MRLCIPFIALLFLAGCGLFESRQLTPEEQQRQSVERHCRNAAQLAKSQARPSTRTSSLPSGDFFEGVPDPYSTSDALTLAQNRKRAHLVTYQNCMAQYGYWP